MCDMCVILCFRFVGGRGFLVVVRQGLFPCICLRVYFLLFLQLWTLCCSVVIVCLLSMLLVCVLFWCDWVCGIYCLLRATLVAMDGVFSCSPDRVLLKVVVPKVVHTQERLIPLLYISFRISLM